MPHVIVSPVFDARARTMCCLPYPRHPRGCPNYGKSPRCPPRAPSLFDHFDESGPFYAVYSVFQLGEHVGTMRSRHPDWSEPQLRCVLYWQNRARARLREEVESFRRGHPERRWVVEETPEAMGCDVTATLAAAGVVLPWPPVDVAYHVALAGLVREKSGV